MPFLNVETGHEFPELIEFRDRRATELGAKLVVRTVDEAIEKGLATPTPGQTTVSRGLIPEEQEADQLAVFVVDGVCADFRAVLSGHVELIIRKRGNKRELPAE